jgi:hypothetical protein
MRKFLPILLLLMTSPAPAQQQTLFGGKADNGIYFGPVLQVSRMSGDIVYFTGFRGTWLINHTFSFGYGSYSLGGQITAPEEAQQAYPGNGAPRSALELDFRYRGIEFEYINNGKKVFHFGLYALVGSGTVNLGDPFDRGFSLNDQVFVAVPALHGMLNVAEHVTATVHVSYRFVAAEDLLGVERSDLNGPALGVELRIGEF